MTPDELRAHIRNLADSRCRKAHPDFHDSLICVGPGSSRGFSPPCSDCLAATEREYALKQDKAQGQKLSPEEAAQARKDLGLP